MNKKNGEEEPEMLEEYDFSGGVRGKYVARLAHRRSVVVLDEDVAQVFPDAESVNRTLRALLPTIQRQSEKNHP